MVPPKADTPVSLWHGANGRSPTSIALTPDRSARQNSARPTVSLPCVIGAALKNDLSGLGSQLRLLPK